MIAESYVSFELAKLLKEKGFDVDCYTHYSSDGQNVYYNYQTPSDGINMPTLQMAMKWLRENKKVFISIGHCEYPTEHKVTWIPEITTFDSVFPDSAIEYATYEEATEKAIRYCLENLI